MIYPVSDRAPAVIKQIAETLFCGSSDIHSVSYPHPRTLSAQPVPQHYTSHIYTYTCIHVYIYTYAHTR